MTQNFSKFRSWFFPVHTYELKILLPMGLMMILIIFNFWIGHNAKDVIIITAPESGAEVINYLKVGVFIISVFFVMLYSWLTNRFSPSKIFYGVISFFAVFFFLFGFVLFPYQEFLHCSKDTLIHYKTLYPWAKWCVPMIGYWSFSLFYIFSELWAAIVLTLLFWQFANRITSVEQSKRFYMLYGVFNGLGGIIAGFLMSVYSSPEDKSHVSLVDYGQTLQEMVILFILSCVIIMLIYHWVHHNVKRTKGYEHIHTVIEEEKQREKLSLGESMRYISRSRYIGLIAILVISYNLTINFVEVTWKSQIKALYVTPHAVQHFYGNLTIYIGTLTLILGFLGSGFVRRFSWRRSALVTPAMALIMGGSFLALVMFGQGLSSIGGIMPLLFFVNFGQAHNLLCKSCKHSFFNSTREMAYIPLDSELKTKGKAAVDVIGGRIGKFSASAIQALLLSFTMGAQLSIVPYLSIIFLVVIGVWIWAINGLNQEFIKAAYGKK